MQNYDAATRFVRAALTHRYTAIFFYFHRTELQWRIQGGVTWVMTPLRPGGTTGPPGAPQA